MTQSSPSRDARLQIVLPQQLKEKLRRMAAGKGKKISALVRESIEDKVRQLEREVLEDEFYTSEGCFIVEVSNTPDDPDVSVARARVTPGVTTRWHRLTGTAERYIIIEGLGRMEVGGFPAREVSPGDVVLIPPESRQRITNIGRRDLIFLAICTPRFRREVYEDIDDAPLKGHGFVG
jgi:mannose-6-phosphate isomerase-like protein (cupin superfamily)